MKIIVTLQNDRTHTDGTWSSYDITAVDTVYDDRLTCKSLKMRWDGTKWHSAGCIKDSMDNCVVRIVKRLATVCNHIEILKK